MSAALIEYEARTPGWVPAPLPTGFVDARAEPVAVVRPVMSPLSTASEPQWARSVRRRFIELAELRHNWDNRGSAAVRKDALIFGQALPPAAPVPSIIPLGHGGLQLVWSNPSAEIEVEVVQPNEVIIYSLDKTSGVEREARVETEFSELGDLLRAKFA